MAVWIGFGLVFAAGCVGLAFVFQPDGQPDAEPVATAAVEPGDVGAGIETAPAETAGAGPGDVATPAAGEAARAPTPQPVTIAGVTSVRLRTGTGFAADERDGVVAALARAGLSEVQDEALPFAVASSRVGYYRPEDKTAAEALAAYIGPVLGYAGPIAVRDYGQLLDDAAPGRLDLWIGG